MLKKGLHEHSELICQVFEVNPEATLLLDLKGKIIKANSQVQVLTGYKLTEIEGKSALSLPFVTKESLGLISKNFLKRLSGKSIPAYDVEIKTKSNSILIGSVLAKILKDENGLPRGLVIVVENVTQQRKLTKDLENLQERTEKYLDVSGSMIVVLGRNAEIKLINRMGLELLGYKPKEILGKNWIDTVIPKEIKSDVGKFFKKIVAGEKEIAVENENEVILKNRKRKLIKWHNSVLRDSDGQVIEVVSSGLDVTSERKAKASLKETQEMLSLVMNHSAEVYYVNSVIYDRLDYVSDQCLQMLGYTSEELKKDWTIVLSDSKINEQAVKITKKAIETGEDQPPYLMEVKTKKGVLKIIEIDEYPIKDESGKVVGLSGVLRDVSERINIENKLRLKIEQFESINEVIVGRELKMIELKEKISELESKLKGPKNEKKQT